MGLVPFVLGVLLEIYVLVQKLMGDLFQSHIAAIVIGVMLILLGFQCIVSGLLGEMLSAQRPQPADVAAQESGAEPHSAIQPEQADG
jgi:putative Mn2+ efflux pump MntP